MNIIPDINECKAETDSCNKAISSCVNNVGDYSCTCKSGYKQGNTDKKCEGNLSIIKIGVQFIFIPMTCFVTFICSVLHIQGQYRDF